MTLATTILAFLATITGYHYMAQSPQAHLEAPTHTTYLFFDSGGVLFESSKNNVIWQLGPQTLFNYWRHNKNKELGGLKKRYYETLDAITNTTGNPYDIRDDEGIILPQLMADWLRGTRSNKEILDLATQAIASNPAWFTNKSEQKVIANMVNMIFTPAIFAKTRTIISETVELLKSCKERGFKIYMLSNWDKESIEYMKAQYKDVFALFDGVIISSEIGAAKPEPAIFNYVTKQFPAAQSILIDDQLENIKAAQKAGMYAIQVIKQTKMIGSIPDIGSVQNQLDAIISPQEISITA
jgi:haloacid dehalogenase superfamily, subfamily IA, variant 3 with third motif having DD or ED/haloacid dehalogenase superfamily, subfamily IA, variant 1 with third motif having Dx(3-4)D or Dx(3-4)E